MGRLAGCVGFLLFLFLSPFLSEASDTDFKKELQKNLEQSKLIINNAKDKLSKGIPITDEINQLKAAAENIKAAHLLVQEQFGAGEENAKSLGSKAIDRHKTVSQGYQKALEEYLALIDGINDAPDISNHLSVIESFLNKIIYKKKKPIFGNLPYSHINYPAKEPNQNSAITPAYKGGNKTVSSEDMKNTEEAPISAETATLAQSLNWNPVSIYEYVKNNIETEWYWGCMKGAEETLRQKSGNDCDQATLLAALLRASGYPARYVRGVIEFFPDIEKAKNLTGINDPQKIAEFFQKAGIPYKTVIAGGRISNIQIEHIWVESQIPYANYRGAVLDEYGKTWLGLDTSIKVTGYAYNQAADGAWQIASGLRDEYLNSAQTQTPLDYLKGKLSDVGSQQNPQLTADSYKLTRTLVPEVLNILPASLQFTEVKITNEYTSIPDELVHKVKFIAKDSKNSELLNSELRILSLSNKSVTITYEPETIEDQQIINSYGGLGNTPAYLVRLRPTLKINGERIAVATDGLPMGADFTLTIEVKSPGTSVQRITNTHVVGNLSVIGITAQKTNGISQTANSETKSAEQILYEEAMSYTNRWNSAEEELASLMHLTITRPIPTVVTIGGVIDVTYLLDTPHGFEWKGVFIDASLKAIETAISHELSAISQNDIEKTFMQLSSLHGSILENKIFEDDFQVDSISTAKLIQLSHEQSANSYELIAIDKSNITTILPTLLLDDNIKEDIQNAVNQNLTVRIPQAMSQEPYAISYLDWTGIGYIKENLETGESGWMLSGMIAGGMTAWQTDKWPPEIYGILSNPYSEPPNTDGVSGENIQKVPDTDLQRGIAGEKLAKPLMIKVFDKQGKAVVKAEVIFTVKAGGGKLINPKTQVEEDTVTVETDSRGIGTVYFKLGKETKANPSYVQLNSGDKYLTQIGENIIDASLKLRRISVPKPFTAYGMPGEATKMIPLHGDNRVGEILSFAGFISVFIADKNDNPISNLPVVFEVLSAIDGSTGGHDLVCKNPNQDTRQASLFETSDECLLSKSPTLGECQSESATITELTHSRGAAVEVIFGGIPYGIYPIKAKYENLSYTFNLYTYAFGNCNGETSPSLQLNVDTSYLFDNQGNNINAGKVGTLIPVTARMYLIKEGEEQKDQELPCENGKITCKQIIGSREYTIETNFTTSTLTFSGEEGVSKGNGVYEGQYILQPGKNNINITGTATIEADRSNNTCDGGCATIKQQISSNDFTQIEVYGINIKTDPLPIIMVDEKGYATTDYKITYTIEPLEYQALTAYAFIYKDGNPEPIAQIPTETKGAGFATISRGFQFDVNSKYEAEVILNYGTGVEIKSGKEELPIVEIYTADNNNTKLEPNQLNANLEPDQLDTDKGDAIKYGDGDRKRPEKIYHIELKSLAVNRKCTDTDLAGVVKIINKDNNSIEIPNKGQGYFPAEYKLSFSLANDGKCKVKINDEGKIKEEFILSNRMKDDLANSGNDLSNIAVLYGGIGNTIEIDIDDMKQYYSIEPVGVIVLGIDGLRQDVLYSSTEVSYNDSQGCVTENCNVIVNGDTFPGLSQIIKDTNSIKLKDVTAIFPSITYASWASIFTGKQAGETGIMGNEYFARDLYRSNTTFEGLSGFPPGLITYSDGAFKTSGGLFGSAWFYSKYVIPADWHNDTYKDNSIPAKTLLAKTIYEETNELIQGYNISTDKQKKCDNSEYECKSAVIFNHYAKGSDRWRTISNPLKAAWDALTGGVAYLMDSTPSSEAISFINNYFASDNPDKKRKRFPAIFTIYFAGLDHEAHDKGMGSYVSFFKGTTDSKIKEVIDVLKNQGEFDNKIFIIVADHGMTAMPIFGRVTLYPGTEDERDVTPDTSCKLKVDGFNKRNIQDSEKANNNLHIWELGEVFKAVGEVVEQATGITLNNKVLAPKEITVLFKDKKTKKPLPNGAAEKNEDANIIAAFNGPMAHVYIKGSDWGTSPDISKVKELAEIFRVTLQGAKGGVSPLSIFPDAIVDALPDKIGRLSNSVDEILVRDGGVYKIYTVNNAAVTFKDINSLSTEYIDAVNRIEKMNNINRSGDIVLIMKDSTSGSALDRYTTGVACKSWHGSLNPSDSYVPFIVSYPGGNKTEMENILKKDAVCANDYSNCKGNWKLTDIVKEIISEQFK